jgi:hypothetical protein
MAIKVKSLTPMEFKDLTPVEPTVKTSYYLKRDYDAGYGLFKITTVDGEVVADEMIAGGDVLSITFSKLHECVKKDLGL